MTREFSNHDPEVRDALKELFRDRFDGVDFEQLNRRVIADAAIRAGSAGPAEVLAGWSRRTSLTAGGLIAAVLTALLLFSDGAEADTVPPGFWSVAEELLAGVAPDTRRLIVAGSETQEMLNLIIADAEADAQKEVDRR
jgi:hypothetical protein